MVSEQKQLLSLVTLPARLNPEQTAWYLGFQPHDVSILVAAGVLKPLGNPPPNGVKYFALSMLAELRNDTKWLSNASNAMNRHWKKKNSCKGNGAPRRFASAPSSTVPGASASNHDS